jgi:hypothetical protein
MGIYDWPFGCTRMLNIYRRRGLVAKERAAHATDPSLKKAF